MKSKEHLLLGDINCNYLASTTDTQLTQLKQLSTVYQLTQLINEPTRVTSTSRTLIDVILTNEPSRIMSSGVMHFGISDHSLVYTVRKFAIPSKNTHKYVTTRSFKDFNANAFRDEIKFMDWNSVENCYTPDDMIEKWYNMFINVANKHAPIRTRRIRSKKSPWLTTELRSSIINRDKFKKQAMITKDQFYGQNLKKK